MSDIRFIFIVLNTLEVLVFCYSGYLLSRAKSNGEYWRKALLPILAYAVVTGLRFGREIDWNVYYFRYVGIGENINYVDSAGLVFRWLCHFFYNIGIPYHIFIMFQCIFLIFTILLLVNKYRKQATFILPTILTLIALNDNFIRWYVAASFFLLAINSMMKGQRSWMIIWFACAFLSHYGIIVLLPALLLKDLLNRFTLNRIIAVGLLFACCFVLSITQFTFLVDISEALLGAGDMGSATGYLQGTERLINGEMGRFGIGDRGIKNVLHFFTAAPIIWYAQDVVKRYKYGTFFYNLFVAGAISFTIFNSVEILGRYSQILYLFAMIAGGILFYDVWQRRHKASSIMLILCFISFSFLIMQNVYNTFTYTNEYRMLFMWDANGQETIPFSKFQ